MSEDIDKIIGKLKQRYIKDVRKNNPSFDSDAIDATLLLMHQKDLNTKNLNILMFMKMIADNYSFIAQLCLEQGLSFEADLIMEGLSEIRSNIAKISKYRRPN